MKLLERLDRIFRPIAIPNLTVVLIACQAMVFFLGVTNPALYGKAMLVSGLVMQGEVWRLVSFVMVPPRTGVLFTIIAWYLFYLMGTALESHWGTVRYNVFLWVGGLLTIAVSFLVPSMPMSNAFLIGSVFLAFATLYPDFEILLAFILPVKVKWLALLAAVGYAGGLLFGGASDRLAVIASIGNYMLFFAPFWYSRFKHGQRRRSWQAKQTANAGAPRHTCFSCGTNNLLNAEMDFRYCSTCDECFCADHLRNHEHSEIHSDLSE